MAKESVGSGSESVLSTGQPAGEPDLADGQPEISRSDGVGREPVTSEESKIHRKDKWDRNDAYRRSQWPTANQPSNEKKYK